MTTSPDRYPRWTTSELVVPEGEDLEYKFIVQCEDRTGPVRWESIEGNRLLEIAQGAGSVEAESVWDDERCSTLMCPSPQTSPNASPTGSTHATEEETTPQAQRMNSVEARGAAITPPVCATPPGTVARIQALTKELAATDRLLVERNQFHRQIELDMGMARQRVKEQASELAAKDARLVEADSAMEALNNSCMEKTREVEELRQRLMFLEGKFSAEQSDYLAQVQRQEATIEKLQRQLSERDFKIEKLTKKVSQSKDLVDKRKVSNGGHLSWKKTSIRGSC